MPLQATSGAASYDAFGGDVAAVPQYIEEVFSTWLYTGNSSTQTIVNGIDLLGKGGLVWNKTRNFAGNNFLIDTARGVTQTIYSNERDAQQTKTNVVTSFNANGFTAGNNADGYTNASWTFRKQPKFFDVVTYTGDGSALKTIAHNLGSTPGCMIIKSTSSASWNWIVYHRSLGISQKIQLNLTNAAVSENGNFGGTSPTSTQFSVGFNATNESGGTYVAYLFAHDAGGFGLTGTDNVISCGSFSPNGTSQDINLGYEPQWMLIKRTAGARDWFLVDNMRGWTANSASNNSKTLNPNLSAAETDNLIVIPTATGFTIPALSALNNDAHIYIAIRRGPMKVPTTGTSVYNALDLTGTGSTVVRTGAGFTPDLIINRAHANDQTWWADRLRGVKAYLGASNTNPETGSSSGATQDLISFDMDGVTFGSPNYAGFNNSGSLEINWLMKRAPSFFDEVCYAGTGAVGNAVSHNLGVAPELMIIKARGGLVGTNDWQVLSKINSVNFVKLVLNANSAELGPFTYAVNAGLAAQPTSTTFTVNNTANFNNGSTTYVAYLFATCPGVSKVGTYTGNGTTQAIACGFTGGARFVLIKRTDDTGDWYVWDSARGIVAGNDPYLLLNSTAAEVTGTDYIDTSATGFEISSTAPAAINASGGTFVFLAIA